MEPLPQVDPHPLVIVVLLPFIAIFLWAAWVEIRRWWLYGPSLNRRGDFPIDESAPSYQAPPDEELEKTAPHPAQELEQETHMTDAKTRIDETVKENDVVLYMKGTKTMPQCGFSSRVAGVLNYMGIDYRDINVLEDEEIRQGIKDYADWPTIPQLYVKGEFVGGCDIITEMTLSGELDQLFDDKGVSYDKDAAEKIREANA